VVEAEAVVEAVEAVVEAMAEAVVEAMAEAVVAVPGNRSGQTGCLFGMQILQNSNSPSRWPSNGADLPNETKCFGTP